VEGVRERAREREGENEREREENAIVMLIFARSIPAITQALKAAGSKHQRDDIHNLEIKPAR
jgi:hypothetical protein